MKVEHLFERVAKNSQPPTITPLETEQAIAMLNQHCSDALWMLRRDKPLWRGEKTLKKGNFFTVDPTLTTRVSQNTSNYYTLVLDNIPSMRNFPKRSKSFIASTEYETANSYAYKGEPFALIPYDGVPIGSVNKNDIWDATVTIFNANIYFPEFNKLMKDLKINSSSWQRMISSAAKVGQEIKLNGVPSAIGKANRTIELKKISWFKWLESLEDSLNDAFDPKNTGFTLSTTANFKWKKDIEVWVGGPCVMISRTMWNELRKAL